MSIELLARLNPTTVKFDTGKGGIAELTAQDIAAAVGMVPVGLGREVFLIIGWPEAGSKSRLMTEAVNAACAELNRQFDAATTAGIRYALAQWEQSDKRRQVAVPRDITTRWPRSTVDMLPMIVSACLTELAHPRKCLTCGGRGEVTQNKLVVPCSRCGGRGTLRTTDASRAESLKMHAKSFKRHGWRDVYHWMLGTMTDSYYDAERYFHAALAKREP